MTTPTALDTGTRSRLIRRGDRLLAPISFCQSARAAEFYR